VRPDIYFVYATAALWAVALSLYGIRIASRGVFHSERVSKIGGTAMVGRGLMERGGRIYAMTSAGGARVLPFYGPVSAAKAASNESQHEATTLKSLIVQIEAQRAKDSEQMNALPKTREPTQPAPVGSRLWLVPLQLTCYLSASSRRVRT
jgi:hypothetical protein